VSIVYRADIALIGLAVMGQNLILNMNDHNFVVSMNVHDSGVEVNPTMRERPKC